MKQTPVRLIQGQGLLLALAIMAAMGVSCVSPPPAPGSRGPYGRLLWSDEFEGESVPDPAAWTPRRDGSGSGSDELQCYKNDPANLSVSGGIMRLTALHENWRGRDYSSGGVASMNTWTYGRVEIRAKLAAGLGLVSLIRLESASGESWPEGGEIVLLEQLGSEAGLIRSSLQTGSRNLRRGNAPSAIMKADDCASAFHVYAVEWRPQTIDIYFDETRVLSVRRPEEKRPSGEALATRQDWPFDSPFRLCIELAIGGARAGQSGVDETAFPASMEIDWVRVWDLGIKGPSPTE